jgi:hypothetical protein
LALQPQVGEQDCEQAWGKLYASQHPEDIQVEISSSSCSQLWNSTARRVR